jgi:hypothetical protein
VADFWINCYATKKCSSKVYSNNIVSFCMLFSSIFYLDVIIILCIEHSYHVSGVDKPVENFAGYFVGLNNHTGCQSLTINHLKVLFNQFSISVCTILLLLYYIKSLKTTNSEMLPN